MIKLSCAILLTSLVLIGCDRQGADIGKTKGFQPKVAVKVSCAPPPALALSPSFDDPAFDIGSSAFQSTKANFESAYQKSCDNGVLREGALVDAKASDRAHLFLLNAPEANVTAIYLNGDDSNAKAPEHMVLESAFITDEGTHVPSVDELEEAIFCKVKGASPKEQEESGRCLPD